MIINEYILELEFPNESKLVLIYRGNDNVIISRLDDTEIADILVPRKILEGFIELIR
jgi:hypothetical protein